MFQKILFSIKVKGEMVVGGRGIFVFWSWKILHSYLSMRVIQDRTRNWWCMGEGIIIKVKPWVVNKKHGIRKIEKLDRSWITLSIAKRRKTEQVGTDVKIGWAWLRMSNCITFLDVAGLWTWDGRGGDCQKFGERKSCTVAI